MSSWSQRLGSHGAQPLASCIVHDGASDVLVNHSGDPVLAESAEYLGYLIGRRLVGGGTMDPMGVADGLTANAAPRGGEILANGAKFRVDLDQVPYWKGDLQRVVEEDVCRVRLVVYAQERAYARRRGDLLSDAREQR